LTFYGVIKFQDLAGGLWMFRAMLVGITAFFSCCFVMADIGQAAGNEMKIATISVQDIVTDSAAGQEAKKVLEGKMSELQQGLKGEQDSVRKLKEEIEKKNSVWSEEVRLEKERDYQKQVRDLELKSDDARYSLKKLEKELMEPIFKELHEIIAETGKKQGFTLILEYSRQGLMSRSGLLYADESLDINESVLKALNERMAKAEKK